MIPSRGSGWGLLLLLVKELKDRNDLKQQVIAEKPQAQQTESAVEGRCLLRVRKHTSTQRKRPSLQIEGRIGEPKTPEPSLVLGFSVSQEFSSPNLGLVSLKKVNWSRTLFAVVCDVSQAEP